MSSDSDGSVSSDSDWSVSSDSDGSVSSDSDGSVSSNSEFYLTDCPPAHPPTDQCLSIGDCPPAHPAIKTYLLVIWQALPP